MNSIQGTIVGIEVSGNLSLVSVDVGQQTILKAIVVETPETADYLVEGQVVKTLFKETEVVLAVGTLPNISLQNRIPGTIKQVDRGALLSKVVLDTHMGEITSIISTNSANQLELAPDVAATVLIKLNEVMLSKT